MNKKQKINSLLCVIIPFIFGVIIELSAIMATILDVLNNNGIMFLMFEDIFNTCALYVPIPGSILSMIGVVNAIQLKKQCENTIHLIVIGIISILVFLNIMLLVLMSV